MLLFETSVTYLFYAFGECLEPKARVALDGSPCWQLLFILLIAVRIRHGG